MTKYRFKCTREQYIVIDSPHHEDVYDLLYEKYGGAGYDFKVELVEKTND